MIDLGIRPEHLKLEYDVKMKRDDNVLAAKVKSFELLGRESLIHLEVAGREIITICSGRTRVQAGQTVGLITALSEIHLFAE